MSIAFPPELKSFVDAELSQGRYPSEGDLVCDAVRLLQAKRVRGLRAEIDLGQAELDAGRGINCGDDELESFFDEIDAEYERELATESRSA